MIRYLTLHHIPIPVLFLGLLLLMPGCSGDEPSTPAATEPPRAERVAKDGPRAADIVEPESKAPVQSTAARSPSRPVTDWRETFEGLDLDDIFHTIAGKVRYEPYRGVLRGAAGTWQAASGNALDQSMLLAEILQLRGYRTRFVSGTLQGDNLAAVLRGLYPPVVPKPALGSEFAPYGPIDDPALLAAADHFWVEVYQPGTWLPLDPSFPRAQPGEAYAVAKSRYDEMPRSLFQTVTMTLWQELRDGSTSQLGSLEETVAALGLEPLSLIIHRIPKSASDDSKKSRGTTRTLGGLGGALSGNQPEPVEEPAAPELVAVEHQRQIYVNGAFQGWENTLVAEQEREGYIAREWLEFEVTIPGTSPVRARRDLYRDIPGGSREPRAVRHYAISVVPGPITEAWLQEERARTAAELDLDAWQRELRRATSVEPGSDAAMTLASTMQEQGGLAGISGGRLVSLTYAAASDAMSRQVAFSNGVEIIWPFPRILITSMETEELDEGGTDTYVTLDLRLDQVRAVPFPGFPARAAQLFQTARGMQNSVLEGTVLSGATGLDTPFNTAVVMVKAADDGTPLLTLNASNAARLADLDELPPHASELIAQALQNGHDVIVPERATRLGNQARWGWWQVDRDTGEVIGVMDDGQHQASTNYSFNLSKVGLDDRSGFAIGAIIGANSTLFTISGLMLKYGETSQEMIAEVEKYVKSIMCRSCPSKAGISAGASGGISAGNDCFKIEKKVDAKLGASAKISFCESYQEGFACASGLLLQGLTGSGGAKATIGGQIGVNAQVNCEKAFGGLKVDDSGYSVNGKNQIRN